MADRIYCPSNLMHKQKYIAPLNIPDNFEYWNLLYKHGTSDDWFCFAYLRRNKMSKYCIILRKILVMFYRGQKYTYYLSAIFLYYFIYVQGEALANKGSLNKMS